MLKAEILGSRFTFEPFCLNEDVNPQTGKKGIRRYSHPIAIFFLRIFKRITPLSTLDGRIWISKNSLRHWLACHRYVETHSPIDIERAISEVVNRGQPYRIKKALSPLVFHGEVKSSDALKNWLQQLFRQNEGHWFNYQETIENLIKTLNGSLPVKQTLLNNLKITLTLMKSAEGSKDNPWKEFFQIYERGNETEFHQKLLSIQQDLLAFSENFETQVYYRLSEYKLKVLQVISNADDVSKNFYLKVLGKDYGIPGYELAVADTNVQKVEDGEARALIAEKYLNAFREYYNELVHDVAWRINSNNDTAQSFLQWIEENRSSLEPGFGYYNLEKQTNNTYITSHMTKEQKDGIEPYVSQEEVRIILDLMDLTLPNSP